MAPYLYGAAFFCLIPGESAIHITAMTLAKDVSKCPYCKEPIVTGAVRCKHCHADLTTGSTKQSFWTKYNCFRTGFLCGLLFAVIIFVIGYFHFTGGD